MFNIRYYFQILTRFFVENRASSALAVVFASYIIYSEKPFHSNGKPPVSYQKREPAIFLLVVIPSAPGDLETRNQVRNTWLNYQTLIPEERWQKNEDKKVKSLFVIGTKDLSLEEISALDKEAQVFKDILLLSEIQDSYDNLANKLLMTYNRLVLGPDAESFKFMLKTDTDSFFNIPGMVERLQEDDVANERYVYLGYFMGSQMIYRQGKWADPDWNDCDTYLPYAGGGGYVLSYLAVSYIAHNADMLRVFVNEDTNIGFWLSPLKIARIHDKRFNSEFISRGCRNSFLISHAHTRDELLAMHETFLESQGREICVGDEFSRRQAYAYNWAGLPYMCCNKFSEF